MINQKSGGLFSRKNLSNLDFYGAPIQISIKEQQSFSTTIGLMFSFGIILTCFLIFYQDISNSFNQQRPKVSPTDTQQIESNRIPLTPSNFTLAILLTDINKKSFDGGSSVYNLSVQVCARNRLNPQGQKINSAEVQYIVNISLELCKNGSSLVTPQQQSFFKNFNLTNVHCISPHQDANTKIFLQGTPSSNYFSYLKINVAQCNNATSNNTCASIEEIDAKLTAGNYVLYMLDNLVDMNQDGNPYSMTQNIFFTPFSNTTSKTIYTTYKQSVTQTDTGLISSNINEFFGLLYDTERESQEPANNQFTIQHIIMLDPKQIIFFRSYQKLQIVFGSLGGLWNVLYYLCAAFMTPIVKKLMYLEIINKTFSFVDDEETKGEKQTSLKRSMTSKAKTLNLNTLQVLTLKQQEENNQEYSPDLQSPRMGLSKSQSCSLKVSNMRDIKQYIKQKQTQMQLSLRSIVGMIFFSSRKKEKAQLEYGEMKIIQNLDVIYILRKLHELEKLKCVLLNKDQQTLFNFLQKPTMPQNLHIPTPVIKLPEGEFSKDIERQATMQQFAQESPQRKVQDAYEAYKKILSLSDKSNLDHELVQGFDKDIAQLFDHIIDQEQQTFDEVKEHEGDPIMDQQKEESANFSSIQSPSSEQRIVGYHFPIQNEVLGSERK